MEAVGFYLALDTSGCWRWLLGRETSGCVSVRPERTRPFGNKRRKGRELERSQQPPVDWVIWGYTHHLVDHGHLLGVQLLLLEILVHLLGSQQHGAFKVQAMNARDQTD